KKEKEIKEKKLKKLNPVFSLRRNPLPAPSDTIPPAPPRLSPSTYHPTNVVGAVEFPGRRLEGRRSLSRCRLSAATQPPPSHPVAVDLAAAPSHRRRLGSVSIQRRRILVLSRHLQPRRSHQSFVFVFHLLLQVFVSAVHGLQ
ncbi:hypothetical protein PIB30_105389, partial [Stylosanthes scabra]|nr:hypothetical protein [Stylosanthes scabra]